MEVFVIAGFLFLFLFLYSWFKFENHSYAMHSYLRMRIYEQGIMRALFEPEINSDIGEGI